MPHVIIKLYPGRSDEQKIKLAKEIASSVSTIANCKERSVSVAIEEVNENDWAEDVYRPEIIEKKEKLIIEPGYNPFD